MIAQLSLEAALSGSSFPEMGRLRRARNCANRHQAAA